MLLTHGKGRNVPEYATQLADDYYVTPKRETRILETIKGIVVFEGQIFNYNRQKFESSDALLIDMFNSMTPRQVARESAWWDGFWSICFFESRTGKVYCWTDPLGKKQLYYTDTRKSRCLPDICTEIIPIVDDRRDFDLFFRSEAFKWGYNFDDRTPWNTVKRFIPNRLYEFTLFGDMYISPNVIVDWEAPVKNLRDLYGLMVQAVNDRISDGKKNIGMMLSGGLDSSIIAAILKELGADVKLYTINNGNDYPFAHMMAGHLGMPIKDLSYDMDSQEFVKSCFRYNETPIDLGSVVPNQAMFKNIPADIILSGDGADELFGGYNRIDDYDSQLSDVFQELTYYHLPRLDRACNRYGKELRNPFLAHDVIRYALKVPYNDRVHKKILKDVFGPMLPLEIVQRAKLPLKNDDLKRDPLAYRKKIHSMFYSPDFL